MSVCKICGNEVFENIGKCPYCGNQINFTTQANNSKKQVIQKINIKIGLPTVNEAIREAKSQMTTARKKNIKVIKLVHGYGSTGTGGTIRIKLRKELEKMKSIGIISDIILGENFSRNRCKQLIRRFPDLKKDEDMNRGNKGITLVEL